MSLLAVSVIAAAFRVSPAVVSGWSPDQRALAALVVAWP
jgi:hypothetical protein